MTLLFFGSDPWFSPPVLEAILKAKHQVLLIVTKGDALKNFRFNTSDLRFTQGKTAADISLARLDSLIRSDLAISRSDLSIPDVIVLASFGPPFLPSEVLKWPKYGCLNVHASLLPRWRGASPVFAALAAGDRETGVSIMRMTEEIDRGPVLGQSKTTIRQPSERSLKDTPLRILPEGISLFDDRETLTKRLAKLGGKLIVETLKKLKKGQITETPQSNESPTSYTRRLTKEAGRIDWQFRPGESAPERSNRIERFIRAVTPWPGAWTVYREEGKGEKVKGQTIKILKAHLVSPLPSSLFPLPSLVIDEVQLPGKNPISWKQFLAGHPGAKLM